jgi:hypothetical protein
MSAQSADRCERCGAPIRSPLPSGDGAFPVAVAHYIGRHRNAMRLSAEWRRLATLLEDRGHAANAAYLEIACGGARVQIPDGDLTAVHLHYETRLAAAADDIERHAIVRERDEAIDRAENIYRRWQQASGAIGAEAAATSSEEAWAIVDALDLDALWAVEPGDRADVLAMLALLQEVGWDACEPGDSDRQRAAVAAMMSFLERS